MTKNQNNVVIKNFESYVEFVKALHNDIPHHHLVSWDIAVGDDEQPIFIEHNFAGLMWLYQAATGRPIFGDLTDEVIRKMA
ncbi:sugar-transfer associated ATP-grasp domain-containing protein [Halomonas mongoliensis]|uniref:sugar-transfer associated ATP-grasp domain-containing protein n=1 Tax=Halomonas mongoliensis TaxID=321265 RepID=UPI00403AA2C3